MESNRNRKKTAIKISTIFVSCFFCLLLSPGVLVAAPQEKEAPALPAPEEVEIITRDGVKLLATFYPGTGGKETVPIILLHGFEGSRADWRSLPESLQQRGYAILVPDLRGHGRSTQVDGMQRPLEARSMPQAAVYAIPGEAGDVEACKKFLIAKNDAGELNLNKLCLIGSEMGAVMALEWSRLDWSWPPLPTYKQGQDVKGLVLISPSWAFRGVQIRDAMADPVICRDIGMYILVGEGKSKALRNANRLYSTFLRCRPGTEDLEPAQRNLFYRKIDTSLQGAEMFSIPALESLLCEKIANFIKLCVENKSFPWVKRTQEL